MEKSNVTTLPNAKVKKEKNNIQNSLSPREIVSELDRFVVGQNNAKRAVAIARKIAVSSDNSFFNRPKGK